MKKLNFSKKQKVTNGYPASTRVNLNQILESANILPLDYSFSDGFTRFSDMQEVNPNASKSDSLAVQYGFDGVDPLDWARSRIGNLAVDEYTIDILNSEIESKARSEIEYINMQHVNHLYSIKKIVDREKGERKATQDFLTAVDNEIDTYDLELKKLYALEEKSNKED